MFIGPLVTGLCEEEVHTEVAKGEMVFLRPRLVLSMSQSQFVFVTMIKSSDYSKSTLDHSYYSVAGEEK